MGYENMTVVWILLAGLLSFFLTGLVRHYTLTKSLLDVPNARSSHTVPTPSTGGLGFVITLIICSVLLVNFTQIDNQAAGFFRILIIGGILIAITGLIDDIRHVPAKWRLIVQGIVACYAVIAMEVPEIGIGILTIQPNIMVYMIFVIGMIWLINLYNFMDGIDGLAGIETIFSSGSAAMILLLGAGFNDSILQSDNTTNYSIILLLVLVSISVFGFLMWNWSPAKIFMGDVGSSYLGFLFAILLVFTPMVSILTIWTWLILLGIFIVDATITLIKRVLSGQQWYAAHRSHAYQNAAQQWSSHRKVTIMVLVINIVWLLPLAWLATVQPEWGIVFTIIAYLPLMMLALYLKAGKTYV